MAEQEESAEAKPELAVAEQNSAAAEGEMGMQEKFLCAISPPSRETFLGALAYTLSCARIQVRGFRADPGPAQDPSHRHATPLPRICSGSP